MTAEPWPWRGYKDQALEAECYETPTWAAERILDVELLTPTVVDPACGAGVLAIAADRRGYNVFASDLYDWGFGAVSLDFLTDEFVAGFVPGNTVFMNPPFSRAAEFVEVALRRGARKVLCFQRFAWFESRRRSEFWQRFPPQRVYICVERASCWRIDIPPDERKSGTTMALAWFVWEAGQPAGPMMGRLSKGNTDGR